MNRRHSKNNIDGTGVLIIEVLRGAIVESRHRLSMAVVDVEGRPLLAFGDIHNPYYLRSSAKPFQALPLVERGLHDDLNLTARQLALMCASHTGTDAHAELVRSILEYGGFSEDSLLCGLHTPYDRATADRLLKQGENISPIRHNCSGKHAGMLLLSRRLNTKPEDYLQRDDPVQREILRTFSEMVGVTPSEIEIGTDGCSAPNFAIPLKAAAHGYARLMDPSGFEEARVKAASQIVQAMLSHPDMVSGEGQFDTQLMLAANRRLLSKGGAEGYQAIGIPSNLLLGCGAAGLILKVHDGDGSKRARSVATMTLLETLGLLSPEECNQLADFGERELINFRELEVGFIRMAGESKQRLLEAYERI